MFRFSIGGATIASLIFALAAQPAHAKPEYVDEVNNFCTQQNRTPPKPIPVVFPESCAVCHKPGTFDKVNVVEPGFSAFKNGKNTGDFSFFCPAVANANQPPVLAPIGNRQATAGQGLVVSMSATDPERNALSFAASNLPRGAQLADNRNGTAELRWTPGLDQAGNYPVTVTVTDNGTPAGSDSETFTVSVGRVNRPPVLAPISDQSLPEGGSLALPITATDADGDALRFSAADLPTGAELRDMGNGRAELRWVPGYNQAGNYPVRVTVTDAGTPAASDTKQATLTVGDVNRPPVLGTIGSRTVKQGETLRLMLTASDPDGDGLRFAAANPPQGSRFADLRNGSAEFEWTPGPAQAGSHKVTFSVTDDYTPMAADSEEVTITVGDAAAVNRPPVLDPIGARTGYVGERLEIPLSASDPDMDALRFSASGLPAGARLVEADGSTNFEWTPGADQTGNHKVTFSVSDTGTPPERDMEDVTITVGAGVNRPPVMEPIGNRRGRVGEAIMIPVLARDPDGAGLRYRAQALPAGAELRDLGNDTAEIMWTPAREQMGSHPVKVTVMDSGTPVESDSESFMIQVAGGEPAPGDGAPRLVRARYRAHDGRLQVNGYAAPGTTVKLYDEMGTMIGETLAYPMGGFSAKYRPLVVPCNVVAMSSDVPSNTLDVEGAPETCATPMLPPMRVRAWWHCGKQVLRVDVHRAPSDFTVGFRDENGELGDPDRVRGRSSLFRADTKPEWIQVGVGAENLWTDPVEVRQVGRCMAPASQ
jgi:PKD repeat protein